MINKAFLLAAGEGRRLRPITDTVPKCLIPVKGRALIEYWFDLFEKYGITKILINTHHLDEKVAAYLDEHKRKYIEIHTFYEPILLGSGGTIKANERFVRDAESFFICYADNLTTADLNAMEARHLSNDKVLTMGVFKTDTPESCGIVELDERQEVIRFEEKPRQPKSNLAAAGIYIARRRIFEYFPKTKIFDLGKDVFPKLIGQIAVHEIKEYLIDIGTMNNYDSVNKRFEA